MDTATIIAIIIGALNLLALMFVAYQTRLTRKSLQLVKRTTEISDLPEADAMLWAQTFVNKWKAELEQIISDEKTIRRQVETGDSTLGDKYGLKTPKGIIIKPVYDSLPTWLQIIVMSSAQYYWECKSAASLLSGEKPEFILRLLPDVINRAKTGVARITEMQLYVENIVPEWYLNCPASMQGDRFMDR